MKKFCLALLAAAAAIAAAVPALADTTLYFQGFEAGTSGWIVSSGGTTPGTITQEASGFGGITAASGNYFALITNSPNDYSNSGAAGPGWGDYGYTFFNGNDINPTVYPGSPFSQSVAVYIDPTQIGTNYWIDMTPDFVNPDGVGCDPAACSDEHNFNLVYTAAGVAITVDGGTQIATLTTPGWYTFQGTYSPGATPTSLVSTNMNIFSGTNLVGSSLVGSASVLGNSDEGTLASDNLGGPGYLWFAVAQNGDGPLAIDNIDASTLPVPEGGSGLLYMLLAGACCFATIALASRRRDGSTLTS
jgi:hypothetical protein